MKLNDSGEDAIEMKSVSVRTILQKVEGRESVHKKRKEIGLTEQEGKNKDKSFEQLGMKLE